MSKDGSGPREQGQGRVREVGTLWISGSLSYLEQLCLKSFVDAGQKITLFHYGEVEGVPEGVILRDGREIIDTDNFLKYERKDSYALFADLFRLHMLKKCPGMIWVDADVYCVRPMTYESDYVFGVELLSKRKNGSPRINNAVLGLPADSPILNDMLEFTSDPYAVPEFLAPKLVEEYRQLAAAGTPLHVSKQSWGVWGPSLLSHFLNKHGLKHLAQPIDAFYPVTFPQRRKIIHRASAARSMITPNTTAMHLWGSNKTELDLRHDGVPSPTSFLGELLTRHGLHAEDAPLRARGWRLMVGELADQIDVTSFHSFADIGARARPLAYEAWRRWKVAILIADVDPHGRFLPDVSKEATKYRKYLIDQGVPPKKVRIARSLEELEPCEVVASLWGLHFTAKTKDLLPVFRRVLSKDGQLFIDIKKGSGGFGTLRSLGKSTVLAQRPVDGIDLARVMLRVGDPSEPAPEPAIAAPASNDESWAAIAQQLAGPDGFFRHGEEHSFLHVPRGSDTLVVTFDNLDIAMEKREDRRPWGYAFIEKQGWSMLGVMANGWTWYRDPWVYEQFDDLATSDFFDRYKRVVFYGASMGGYAACAFSPARPGCEVVAISPQSTLDRSLVPWETRYTTAWGRDYTGPYGDAAEVSKAARKVTLLYDPYEPLDSGHVARFTHDNVMKLRTPLLGHRLGSALQQMGILTPIIVGALNGTLTEVEFYRLLRARKTFHRYQKDLFRRALSRGREDLARRIARWVLTRGDSRFIRKELARLDG
ncbi:MAG: capsular polysaccharide synthesis protein [Gemmobacter sp.]|jgi:hypothetical protein|nr:capsular polysaccharide synthesis protein [Gemmobacter sp.]